MRTSRQRFVRRLPETSNGRESSQLMLIFYVMPGFPYSYLLSCNVFVKTGDLVLFKDLGDANPGFRAIPHLQPRPSERP
jgi:hypothetical protein